MKTVTVRSLAEKAGTCSTDLRQIILNGLRAGRSRYLPVIFHNPMQRSGLALAGAELTLDAWKSGEPGGFIAAVGIKWLRRRPLLKFKF